MCVTNPHTHDVIQLSKQCYDFHLKRTYWDIYYIKTPRWTVNGHLAAADLISWSAPRLLGNRRALAVHPLSGVPGLEAPQHKLTQTLASEGAKEMEESFCKGRWIADKAIQYVQ